MWPVVVIFAGGFLSGLLTLVALQVLGVYVLIKRLNRKTQQQQASHSSSSSPHHQDLDPQQSLDYAHNKKVSLSGIFQLLTSRFFTFSSLNSCQNGIFYLFIYLLRKNDAFLLYYLLLIWVLIAARWGGGVLVLSLIESNSLVLGVTLCD
jgi:hypothetical protein